MPTKTRSQRKAKKGRGEEETQQEEEETEDEVEEVVAEEVQEGDDEVQVVAVARANKASSNNNGNLVPQPPTTHAATTLFDVIDYYITLIIVDRHNRLENWKSLQFYWNLYPFKDVQFGRLYLRHKIASLLVDCNGMDPYTEPSTAKTRSRDAQKTQAEDSDSSSDDESESEQEDNDDEDKDLPMIRWTRTRWNMAFEDLAGLKLDLQRQDAVVRLYSQTDVDDYENEEEVDKSSTIFESKWFGKEYQAIAKVMELQQAIAPIHKGLLKLVDKFRSTHKAPSRKEFLTDGQVKQVLDFVQTMKNKKGQKAINNGLFEEDILAKRLRTATFIEPKQLAFHLSEKPYKLTYVQTKIEHLLHEWNSLVFGPVEPVLVRCRYGIDKSSGLYQELEETTPARAAARSTTPRSARRRRGAPTSSSKRAQSKDLADLRQNRQALRNKDKHGDDPLAAARGMAAQARPGGSSRVKKRSHAGDDEGEGKTSKRLKFGEDGDDSSEGEDDDEDNQSLSNVALSEIPAALDRRRLKSPAASRAGSKFAGADPDEGIFDERGKVKQRRVWTEEEKEAVKQGVKLFGVGKWKEIKLEYPKVLRNRTSVQIKDCWRTMIRHNEVYEYYEEEEEEPTEV